MSDVTTNHGGTVRADKLPPSVQAVLRAETDAERDSRLAELNADEIDKLALFMEQPLLAALDGTETLARELFDAYANHHGRWPSPRPDDWRWENLSEDKRKRWRSVARLVLSREHGRRT